MWEEIMDMPGEIFDMEKEEFITYYLQEVEPRPSRTEAEVVYYEMQQG